MFVSLTRRLVFRHSPIVRDLLTLPLVISVQLQPRRRFQINSATHTTISAPLNPANGSILQNMDLIQKLAAQAAATNAPADASWYIIATAAFAAANEGPFIAEIYKISTATHSTPNEKRRIFRRIRETLLKSTMIIGLPRMLNAYFPLATYILSVEGAETLGSWGDSVRGRGNVGDSERRRRGEEYLGNIYRTEVPRIKAKMEGIAPEVWDACILGYSEYLSELGVLGRIETSQVTMAAMIPLDVKTEVGWHMRGLIRNEGTSEQVREALDISLRVCEAAGVTLRHGVPDMEVVKQERLFDPQD